MKSIRTRIDPSEVYLQDGTDDPEFDLELALAILLLNGVLVVNSHWWKSDWPEDSKESFAIGVLCNDIFGPGADAEPVLLHEIRDLFDHFVIDPIWGPAVWCVNKRKTPPWERFKEMIVWKQYNDATNK